MPLGESPESKERYRRLHRDNRILVFLLIVICVLWIVAQIQIQLMNDAVADTQAAANKAQVSAQSSDNTLQKIINEQINSPQARAATQESRQRILNIEHALCGGPCPAAPSTAPNTAIARN